MESEDKKNSVIPEHIPAVPYDSNLQKQKEEARKLEKKLRKDGKLPEPIIITKNGVKKVSDLTLSEKKDEIIKCASNPIYFIETYLTIFDQTKGSGGEIVKFKLFEFQKDLINNFAENKFVIANKYRQAGVSTTTCAYIAWYVMFKSHRSVAIVADKLETARDELMNDVVEFIDNCPDWLRPKPDVKDTQKLKRYDNGCQLSAFSSKGLRGYTPTLLFWDETAWTEKNDIFWTSAKPTLQTGGRAVFVSCVTRDSFVFTKNGIKQVDDFILDNKLGAHNVNDVELLGTHKVRKSNIFFNNGYVNTFKVKTSYSELESSENHKYWTYKNGKYDWVKSTELNVGDYVSIQKGMNIWGNNDDCSDFKPTESNYIKNIFKPTKITKDIAYLIGLYISEGCGIKRNNRIKNYYGITLTCGDSLSEILEILNLPYYNKDNLHYEIGSLNISEFFEYLGFDLSKKAPEKTIPPRLLEMSKENIIAMMQGIMDGDGWATYNKDKNKLRIGIGLSSLELIKQIRIILNNFGVLTEYKKYITPLTEKVKVESIQHRIIANNGYAKKYFEEIGFRFNRKNQIKINYDINKLKHIGVNDNIPNGSEVLKELYKEVKYYGIHTYLKEHNINAKDVIQKNGGIVPVSRKTILRFINLFKDRLSNDILNKYEYIINDNIVWTKIKSIEKSKNWTYDFSMSNDNDKEWNEHHMSLIYNGIITHNTPNGLDPVFYKTFDSARKNENHPFKAIELWWFNDPRYNKDLEWVKNKGREDEIRIKDENWTKEHRIKLQDDGWEATSPWFEAEIESANGDMRKIAQEILCSFLGSGDNFIAEEYLKRIQEYEVKNPQRQEYSDKNFWIWEDPIIGEDYVIGVDASPGHGDDNSTINILKIKSVIEEQVVKKNGVPKKIKIKKQKTEQVAEYYGKVTPQLLAEIAYQFGVRYNNGYIIVDITGGYGVQTVEKLIEIGYPEESIHYAEVTHKPSRDRLQGYIKKGQKILPDGSVIGVDLIPGFFIGNNRPSVLLEMQRAVHLEDVIIRSVRLLNELKTFVTVPGNRVADHKRSFHDDSIMGLSIALYVLNFDMSKFKQNKGATIKTLDAMLFVNDKEKMAERKAKEEGKKVVNKDVLESRLNSNPDLQKHMVNSWLFNGLKQK